MKRPNDNDDNNDIVSSLLSILNEINEEKSLNEEAMNIMINFTKELLSYLIKEEDNISTTKLITNIKSFANGKVLDILLKEIENTNTNTKFNNYVTSSVIAESNVHKMLMNTLNYLCAEILELSSYMTSLDNKIYPTYIYDTIKNDDELSIIFENFSSLKEEEYSESLYDLIRKGPNELLNELKLRPTRLHKKDTNGFQPLHYMCILGYYDCAKELIKMGADLLAEDMGGMMPLNHVKKDEIRMQLSKYANEIQTNEFSFKRQRNRDLYIQGFETDDNDDVDIEGKFEYVEIATINENKEKCIDLWDAIKRKDTLDALISLRSGASVNTIRYPDSNDDLIVGHIYEPELQNVLDGHHYSDEEVAPNKFEGFVTALLFAAQNSDLEMIKILVEQGANVNYSQPDIVYADGYGYGKNTPLMCACTSLETTQLLLELGADVNAVNSGLPGYEDIPCPCHSALLLALNYEEVARCLVRSGADINYAACSNSGCQGGDMSLACYWLFVVATGDVTWAAELINKHGADVNWPSCLNNRAMKDCRSFGYSHTTSFRGLGKTVLMVAIQQRNASMVQLLLENNADPNLSEFVLLENQLEDYNEGDNVYHEDTEKATPLSVAIGCLQKMNEKKQSLLGNENLPYDVPSMYLDDPIVKLLLNAGAKAHMKNSTVPFMK